VLEVDQTCQRFVRFEQTALLDPGYFVCDYERLLGIYRSAACWVVASHFLRGRDAVDRIFRSYFAWGFFGD
jgi:hypothetical protein